MVSRLEILTIWTSNAFVLRGGVTKARNGVTQADSVLEVVPTDTRRALIRVQGLGGAVVSGDNCTCPVSIEKSISTLLASVGSGLVDFTVRDSIRQTTRSLLVEANFTRNTGIGRLTVSRAIVHTVRTADSG